MKSNIEVTWDQLTQDTSQKVFYEEIVFWKLIVVCLIVIFVVVVVMVEVVIAIFLVVVIIILMLSVIIIIVVIIVVAVMKANDWKLAWQTYYWLLILLTWILIAHCLATLIFASCCIEMGCAADLSILIHWVISSSTCVTQILVFPSPREQVGLLDVCSPVWVLIWTARTILTFPSEICLIFNRCHSIEEVLPSLIIAMSLTTFFCLLSCRFGRCWSVVKYSTDNFFQKCPIMLLIFWTPCLVSCCLFEMAPAKLLVGVQYENERVLVLRGHWHS